MSVLTDSRANCHALPDSKLFLVTADVLPSHVDCVDSGHRRAGLAPTDERLNILAQPLRDELDAPVGAREPPRGGAEQARSNQELIFAFVESHVRGGARVELPLEGCTFRLERDRSPRQPKFEADA